MSDHALAAARQTTISLHMVRGRDQPAKRRAAEPGKRELEMAKTELELVRVRLKIERWHYLGHAVQGGTWIVACAVPIYALQGVIEPLAGEETVINANIVFSVSVMISVVLNLAQAVKLRSQRAEIKRQRERISDLEREAGLRAS